MTAALPQAQVGVIGGSGFYELAGFTDRQEVAVETPFGSPSDALTVGQLGGMGVAFLPRHGGGHRIMPSELPVRANIHALKQLGVQWVISVGAVGSMREEIRPLDLVVPDQLFDRTKSRPSTFFGDGLVVHVGFAEPFCPLLSQALVAAARQVCAGPRSGVGARVHAGGTYICIEGPQFSTKAESRIYRQWGVDVIGMTALPEAKLAREAELCYATLALSTDYDVWHESEQPVTVAMVVANLLKNVETSKQVVRRTVDALPIERSCPCPTALRDAIITQRDRIPDDTRQRLDLLVGKYLP